MAEVSLKLFEPVKGARLSDAVVQQVQQLILQRQIEPGERLPSERELAKRFGASRASVREALRQLEYQGMIEIRKGVQGGAFVILDDGRAVANSLKLLLKRRRVPIDQISEVRVVIEPAIAQRAARHGGREWIERMGVAIRGMKEHVGSEIAFEQFDEEFHRLLGQAQGNPVFEFLAAALLEVIRDAFSGIDVGDENRKRLARSHERVYQAIEKRDGAAARRAMVALIKGVARWLAPFIEPETEPMTHRD